MYGFASDFAALTASSENPAYPAANLQVFRDVSCGPIFRSESDGTLDLEWVFDAPAAINWAHVAWAGSLGLSLSNYPVTINLLHGSSSPATTDLGELTRSKVTGDWFLMQDAIEDVVWTLRIAGDGAGPLGYYQLARAALDSWLTTPTNHRADGFGMTKTPGSTLSDNGHGAKVARYQSGRVSIDLPWDWIGDDPNDLDIWDEFLGFAGEDSGPRDPVVPMWACPDPSLSLDPSGRIFAPMFCYLEGEFPLQRAAASEEALFASALRLVQCGR